jgi:hypothetical protein
MNAHGGPKPPLVDRIQGQFFRPRRQSVANPAGRGRRLQEGLGGRSEAEKADPDLFAQSHRYGSVRGSRQVTLKVPGKIDHLPPSGRRELAFLLSVKMESPLELGASRVVTGTIIFSRYVLLSLLDSRSVFEKALVMWVGRQGRQIVVKRSLRIAVLTSKCLPKG